MAAKPTIEEVLEQHIGKTMSLVGILNQDRSYELATRLQAHLHETADLLNSFSEYGYQDWVWPDSILEWQGE